MVDQLKELKASIRNDPIDLWTASVPTPLPDKEHTVLLTYSRRTEEEHVKEEQADFG
jgi:hypothetical protein